MNPPKDDRSPKRREFLEHLGFYRHGSNSPPPDIKTGLDSAIRNTSRMYDAKVEKPADWPSPPKQENIYIGLEVAEERDLFGKSQHESGSKLDYGKNRLGLVLLTFARALKEVGEVGTFGANKYTDNGWLDVPNGVDRYTDAMLRHLLQEAVGEKIDPESQMLHSAQVAWNALARLELQLRKYGKTTHTED